MPSKIEEDGARRAAPARRELLHEAIARGDLQRLVRGALDRVGREHLADRGLDGVVAAARVDVVRDHPHGRLGGEAVHRHLRDLFAHEFELRDRLAELLVVLRLLGGEANGASSMPPTAPPPRPVRPLLRIDIATLKPLPSPPSTLAAGTFTSANATVVVDDARMPILSSCGPRLTLAIPLRR